MERRSIAKPQSARIQELENSLGERELRTLLATGEHKQNLISRRRLANLKSGRGKLTDSETDRLSLISANASLLAKLNDKSQAKTQFKKNRAMRDWLIYGKDRGTPYDPGTRTRAIKGLAFLGVDPQDGTFYVIRRK